MKVWSTDGDSDQKYIFDCPTCTD